MTPPNQQSEADAAINAAEFAVEAATLCSQDHATLMNAQIETLIIEIHRLRLDRGIAVEGLEIISGKKQCIDNLMSNVDVANETLQKLGEKV